jgi:hypothetical protein
MIGVIGDAEVDAGAVAVQIPPSSDRRPMVVDDLVALMIKAAAERAPMIDS